MKLTVDIQKWLSKENGKAVKMKLTDLKLDKGKERGQIGFINHDDVSKNLHMFTFSSRKLLGGFGPMSHDCTSLAASL